jgi:hypothetical protein
VVLKKKANEDFRASITAQGYLQEEGVHFEEIHHLHQSPM